MKPRRGKLQIGVLILVFIGIIPLYSRPAPITAEMLQAFNRYPDYLNSCVQEFWIIHKHLEAFNLQLNQYYRARLENPENQNLWAKPPVYEPARMQEGEEIYGDLKASARFFTPEVQARLNTRVEEIRKIYTRIHTISGQLTAFSQNANSYSAEQIRDIYAKLDETGVLFEDFNVVKGNLYFDLEQVYRTYQAPHPSNPWVMAADELKSMINLSHRILNALRIEDNRTLKEILPELERALGKSMIRQKAIMREISPRPGSSYDPNLRYTEVLKPIREIADYTRQYLENPETDSRYESLGKGYYYFNYQHINKYSREGQGLIYQYNRFISLSEEPLLRAIAETNIFRTLQPEALPVNFAGRNLVFLLDVSGSMTRPEKLPVFKQAFAYVLEQLSPSDKVSIITYSGNANVVLSATAASQKQKILEAVQQVEVGGASKPEAGFILAYEEAAQNFREKGDNRVIIISDGGFEIEPSLTKLISENNLRKISLDACYFGRNESEVKTRLTGLVRLGGGDYTAVPAEGAPVTLLRHVLGKK
ncbi:MAG: VWA domain-containing protein [Bacteroidia bacterium]|nr:VWA domain-containing protein [Bacteroidia bacterium]